jgi:nucleotide-binding universal stress UspA family protein
MSGGRPVVVVGIDGSDQSLIALELALEEARLRGAVLHVVHCVDTTPAHLHLAGGVDLSTRDIAEEAHEAVWAVAAPILDNARVEVVTAGLLGYPPDELADYCQQHEAVLLVMGTRGRGRIASTVLGSTSLRVLEQARYPVLIAKTR